MVEVTIPTAKYTKDCPGPGGFERNRQIALASVLGGAKKRAGGGTSTSLTSQEDAFEFHRQEVDSTQVE